MSGQSPVVPTSYTQDSDAIMPPSGGPSGPLKWSAYKSIQLRLPAPDKEDTQSPSAFSHFEVLDARPDTARIGMHKEVSAPLSNLTHCRQLVLSKPVASAIAAYLNDHCSNSGAGFSALVVIRSCWVSDLLYTYDQAATDPDAGGRKWLIRLKAEIYAGKDDQYTPLRRFDSSIVVRLNPDQGSGLGVEASPLFQPGAYTKAGAGLADLLLDMTDYVSQLDISQKWAQGKRLSLEDIYAFNQSRLDLPICNDGPLVKGVYSTFEEFRNNAPSIKDYDIQVYKKSAILYLKDDNGKPFPSHTVWGVCDGHTVYVMIGGDLYPAWKEQKAFYVSGNMGLTSLEDPSIANLSSSGRSNKWKPQLYCVDMDTGALY